MLSVSHGSPTRVQDYTLSHTYTPTHIHTHTQPSEKPGGLLCPGEVTQEISRSSSHWKCLLYPSRWERKEKERGVKEWLKEKKKRPNCWMRMAYLCRCDLMKKKNAVLLARQPTPGKVKAEYGHRFGGMWHLWVGEHKRRNFPSKTRAWKEQARSVWEKTRGGMSGIWCIANQDQLDFFFFSIFCVQGRSRRHL